MKNYHLQNKIYNILMCTLHFILGFQIDAFPVWNAWGHALIRMKNYAQARVKFKYVRY